MWHMQKWIAKNSFDISLAGRSLNYAIISDMIMVKLREGVLVKIMPKKSNTANNPRGKNIAT